MPVLLLLLVLVALPSGAADPIDADKVAAIRELMAVTGAEADREQLTRTFTQQMVSVLRAGQVPLTNDSVALIQSEVDDFIREQLENERLQQKMVRIYARYFTLEEIEDLIAFNRSPTGRKASRVMPILLRESTGAAQEWSTEIGPQLTERVRQRLAREGIRIGSD